VSATILVFNMFASKTILPYIGYFFYLASPLLGFALEPNWKTLSARAAPFQTRILDTGSTFAEEDNGVWQLIE
jgi:hypothetical protein